jgi:hypothetical protein
MWRTNRSKEYQALKAMHMRNKVGAPPRSPLRTCAELADEFGVTCNNLRSVIGSDVSCPAPTLKKSGYTAAKYELVAMRKWWAARSAK